MPCEIASIDDLIFLKIEGENLSRKQWNDTNQACIIHERNQKYLLGNQRDWCENR